MVSSFTISDDSDFNTSKVSSTSTTVKSKLFAVYRLCTGIFHLSLAILIALFESKFIAYWYSGTMGSSAILLVIPLEKWFEHKVYLNVIETITYVNFGHMLSSAVLLWPEYLNKYLRYVLTPIGFMSAGVMTAVMTYCLSKKTNRLAEDTENANSTHATQTKIFLFCIGIQAVIAYGLGESRVWGDRLTILPSTDSVLAFCTFLILMAFRIPQFRNSGVGLFSIVIWVAITGAVTIISVMSYLRNAKNRHERMQYGLQMIVFFALCVISFVTLLLQIILLKVTPFRPVLSSSDRTHEGDDIFTYKQKQQSELTSATYTT